MRSLRRLNLTTFFVIALLLAALVGIGVRQNALAIDYNAIVQESESTIFLCATLQDQAMAGLLSRDQSQIFAAAKEFEHLQSRYTSLLDNSLISAQYKLPFMQDLDLGRVIVNLRMLAEKPENDELTLDVMGQLRHMNKQFLQFDRIVVNEMRNRVMKYQEAALIIMATIISLSCFSMVMLYVKSVKPLIVLASQAENALRNGTLLSLGKTGWASLEIRSIGTAINHLLQKNAKEINSAITRNRKDDEFSEIINESTNRINGIINYAQLLIDICEYEDGLYEQKEILNKIIKNGERCASILRNGIS